MEALIKPVEYFDNETFLNEQNKLFLNTWCFAGFKRDYDVDNSFKTFSIGKTPVVVQNLKGKIKAFKNICSHRHSIIQVEKSGIRTLMCPYHGWAYDKRGVPIGIPKKPLFQFSKEELNCLKLEEYKVEFCGQLVFINLNNDAESLEDFLGDFYDEIELASNQFGDLIDVNEIDINANWKILVENTLESYHVNLVHSDSFKRLGASGLKFKFNKYHSKWIADLKSKENDGRQQRINKPYQDRKYKINGYDHLLIFPNLLFSTTYGISFNLSLIEPVSPEKSKFTSYVFMTKTNTDFNNSDNLLDQTYRKSLIDFNRQVFDEDQEVCEGVQKGVYNSHYPGQLSEEESRVCEFQKVYKNKIN